MADQPAKTTVQLGQMLKAKYPGSYDDLGDAEAGSMLKSRYPGSYDDFADAPQAAKSQPYNASERGGKMNGPAPPMHGENLPNDFGGTLMRDAMNAPRGLANVVMHPLDAISGLARTAMNLPSDLKTDVSQGNWGKLGARALEMAAPLASPERVGLALDTGGGALEGGWRGATAPAMLKVRGLPIEIPGAPASVAGGAAGAGIGRVVGGTPGMVVGGAVGAALPAIKGAIQGGRDAFAASKTGVAAPAMEAAPEFLDPNAYNEYLESLKTQGATGPRIPLHMRTDIAPSDIAPLKPNNGPMPRGTIHTPNPASEPTRLPPLWRGLTDVEFPQERPVSAESIRGALPSGRVVGPVEKSPAPVITQIPRTPLWKGLTIAPRADYAPVESLPPEWPGRTAPLQGYEPDIETQVEGTPIVQKWNIRRSK